MPNSTMGPGVCGRVLSVYCRPETYGRHTHAMESAGHVRHSAQVAFNTSQAGHTLPHTRHHRRVRHKYSLFYPWLQSDQPHSGSAQGGARTAIARMRTPLEVARIDHTSCLAHASGRPSPSTAVVPSSRTPPNCLLPILTSCSPVAQRFGAWAEHDGSLSGSTDAVL